MITSFTWIFDHGEPPPPDDPRVQPPIVSLPASQVIDVPFFPVIYELAPLNTADNSAYCFIKIFRFEQNKKYKIILFKRDRSEKCLN